MHSAEEHTEFMAERFNSIMKSHNEGEINAADTIIRGVSMLKAYLESASSMFGHPHFNMHDFQVALSKTEIGASLIVFERKFFEGCMIEGLVQFGSSKNNAYEAVCEWLGISISSAKTSHLQFKDYFFMEEKKKEQDKRFVSVCYFWILKLIKGTERDFPSDYPKASPAYLRLNESCKLAQAEAEKEEWSVHHGHPYE